MAIFDHDRQPKQAVAAVQAACQSIIVVADRLPIQMHPGQAVLLDVHVVSDEREPLQDLDVTAQLSWPDGQHDWAWRGQIDADSVARIGSINWIAPNVTGPVDLTLQLRHRGDEVASNTYRGAIRAD